MKQLLAQGQLVRVFALGQLCQPRVLEIVGFQGGYEPGAALRWDRHERAAIDPDDFGGGFAVWSGTSFAAPVRAGGLAAALEPALPAAGAPDTVADARDRAWTALEALTPLRPPA